MKILIKLYRAWSEAFNKSITETPEPERTLLLWEMFHGGVR